MIYSEEDYEQVKELFLEHHGSGNEISAREINEVVGLDSLGSFPNMESV